jgi:hypothetical protein
MAWLDFALSDAGLEEFGVRHGIHPLHLEDCRSDEQRARFRSGQARQQRDGPIEVGSGIARPRSMALSQLIDVVRRILEPMASCESRAELVRKQLERLLASPGFARNERRSRFLRFVVERHLEGRDSELKESLIAIEVFGVSREYDGLDHSWSRDHMWLFAGSQSLQTRGATHRPANGLNRRSRWRGSCS